jgi:hypothetical protein
MLITYVISSSIQNLGNLRNIIWIGDKIIQGIQPTYLLQDGAWDYGQNKLCINASKLSIFPTKLKFIKVWTTRFVQCAIQCTPLMNGAWFYINFVVTPFLKPWKIAIPSVMKQTNLFGTSISIMPPNSICFYTISLVKLSKVTTSKTLYRWSKIGTTSTH